MIKMKIPRNRCSTEIKYISFSISMKKDEKVINRAGKNRLAK
jgi:hypothetical protein